MTSTGSAIGVGDCLAALMAAAYRLRMPMLQESPSGIGKSDIVHVVVQADRAKWLNWATVHDVPVGVMALVRQHDHALLDALGGNLP